MYGMLHCQSVISLKYKFKQLFVVLRKTVLLLYANECFQLKMNCIKSSGDNWKFVWWVSGNYF